MKEITAKQKELYKTIKDFIEVNGYSPTIRELKELTNIKSTSATYYKLLSLKEKKYIDFIKNSPRTIRILK